MSEQDTASFRALVGSYASAINQIDGQNANRDTQIASLRLQIKGLEADKEAAGIERVSKLRKLEGIRRLLRELEDADTAAIREAEDREFDNDR